jgi:hypothetical protein
VVHECDGEFGPVSTQKPAHVDLVYGVRAREAWTCAGVGESPGGVHGAVEHNRVAEFTDSPGELDDRRSLSGAGGQFHRLTKPMNRGQWSVDLAEFVAVNPKRKGEQVLIVKVFSQAQRPTSPSGGAD